MKKICMLMACVTFTLLGYSQTTQQQLEKQIKDPQRKADAGKADVIIMDKKTIFDSTTFENNAAEATHNKPVKASAKKKQCGSKPKKASIPSASRKQD